MEKDKQLVTLCKEFAELKEPEKDYILRISRALVHFISVKDSSIHQKKNNRNTHTLLKYKEIFV